VLGAAARRGPHSIAQFEHQNLWHRVTVADDGGEVADALRLLVASAEHELEPSRTQRYDVAAATGGWALSEEGDAWGFEATAAGAADAIAARSRARALELAALKGWVRIHGALVDLGGKRILLAGPPGAGKTALALGLALRGGELQGDESVLLRKGEALAVPAPLRLGEGRVAAPALATARAHLRADGFSLLDPARDLGLSWRLRAAPVDHVVVLDPRPGRPVCVPSTPAETLSELAARLADTALPKAVAVRALVGALERARCHLLAAADGGAMEVAIAALSC
jgi:hypothetical protein